MPKETKSQDKPDQVKPAAKSPPAAKAKPAARPSARAKSAAGKKKLARVPEQYVFYCCDGSIFRDMEELAAGLAAMTDEAFAYHCNSEKQDFSALGPGHHRGHRAGRRSGDGQEPRPGGRLRGRPHHRAFTVGAGNYFRPAG